METNDDMESPSKKEGGTESEERINQCMQIESTMMICMLVLNLNLKSVLLFPSSELAGFLSLDSLVRHHLWIIQISAFPLQNWQGFSV